jgi:hypothetical protein
MALPKKQKAWKEDKMNEAVGAVIRKEMGYLKASKHFGVPQTTGKICQAKETII